jgi:hypothetical protein
MYLGVLLLMLAVITPITARYVQKGTQKPENKPQKRRAARPSKRTAPDSARRSIF